MVTQKDRRSRRTIPKNQEAQREARTEGPGGTHPTAARSATAAFPGLGPRLDEPARLGRPTPAPPPTPPCASLRGKIIIQYSLISFLPICLRENVVPHLAHTPPPHRHSHSLRATHPPPLPPAPPSLAAAGRCAVGQPGGLSSGEGGSRHVQGCARVCGRGRRRWSGVPHRQARPGLAPTDSQSHS